MHQWLEQEVLNKSPIFEELLAARGYKYRLV